MLELDQITYRQMTDEGYGLPYLAWYSEMDSQPFSVLLTTVHQPRLNYTTIDL